MTGTEYFSRHSVRVVAMVVLACVPGVALIAADPPAITVYQNTICPVSGKPFDAAIPPLVLTVKRNGHDAQIELWVATEADRETVRNKPGPYLEMAALNRQYIKPAGKP